MRLSIGNQAGKNTGLVIGSTKGRTFGIRVIAEVQLGAPNAQFLEEIAGTLDSGFLEWLSSA